MRNSFPKSFPIGARHPRLRVSAVCRLGTLASLRDRRRQRVEQRRAPQKGGVPLETVSRSVQCVRRAPQLNKLQEHRTP